MYFLYIDIFAITRKENILNKTSCKNVYNIILYISHKGKLHTDIDRIPLFLLTQNVYSTCTGRFRTRATRIVLTF